MSPIRPLSHLSSRTFVFQRTGLSITLSIIDTLKSVQGSLRERSPGVWQVRVSLGRDPTTKRYRYVSVTVRGGRRAAQREAARLVKEAAEGKIPLEHETLAGLLERWLAHIEARGRAPKTLLENRRIAAEIVEELGDKQVRRVRGRDLDALYDRLGARGLSPTSVRRYHAVLSASLNQAVKWGLLEHSPAAQATPPSIERHEPDTPTPEQIKELIEAAQSLDPEFATLLFVAATTGCRRGELCGLQWSDVDLAHGSLIVRKSVSDLPGRLVVRTTKTGLVRKMALDEATTAVFMAQRDLAEQRCELVGATLGASAFVWSDAADYAEPLKPGRITAEFTRLRGSVGLPHVHLHHLRHFAATVMLAGGVDVRTVAGRLGHSRLTLTLQTYAHVMEVTDRRAATLLGESISVDEQNAEQHARSDRTFNVPLNDQQGGSAVGLAQISRGAPNGVLRHLRHPEKSFENGLLSTSTSVFGPRVSVIRRAPGLTQCPRPSESARESWRLLPLRGWSNAKKIPLSARGA